MSCFRFRDLGEDTLASLAAGFAAAHPFPHIVIPDFVALAPAEVLSRFPSLDDPRWHCDGDAYQPGKMTLSNLEEIPEPLCSMVGELNSVAFLQLLERLTGIAALLPDPYLQGAGLHCSGPGGSMAPHSDTHLNQRLGIFRRVNVLIYLNPDWDESCGGCLELYNHTDPSRPQRTVIPTWGTCVIFRSDAHSVHGFPRPIRGDRVRRSIAVYYYTSLDSSEFGGGNMTVWRQHGARWGQTSGTPLARRARLQLYRSLRFGADALAHLAHRIRPRT